mgnify:CR=1 FL=1
MLTTELYFEAHITIEPVFDQQLALAETIAKRHGFRIADLLMLKRVADTPERSQYDTFMTGRSTDYADLFCRTEDCVFSLQSCGFQVWRYKIENTLLDVRLKNES